MYGTREAGLEEVRKAEFQLVRKAYRPTPRAVRIAGWTTAAAAGGIGLVGTGRGYRAGKEHERRMAEGRRHRREVEAATDPLERKRLINEQHAKLGTGLNTRSLVLSKAYRRRRPRQSISELDQAAAAALYARAIGDTDGLSPKEIKRALQAAIARGELNAPFTLGAGR